MRKLLIPQRLKKYPLNLMGEAKIFLIPCETNILRPVIRIEVTDSGEKAYAGSASHSLIKDSTYDRVHGVDFREILLDAVDVVIFTSRFHFFA